MSEDERWYESYPDFTQGESTEEQAERLTHTLYFMADPALGKSGVLLMTMIHWNLKTFVDFENPFILERNEDEPPYFQVIRDKETKAWYSELSHPNTCPVTQSPEEMTLLKSIGWLEPNTDSPNWHREYSPETPIYQIAADGAEGFIKGFAK